MLSRHAIYNAYTQDEQYTYTWFSDGTCTRRQIKQGDKPLYNHPAEPVSPCPDHNSPEFKRSANMEKPFHEQR